MAKSPALKDLPMDQTPLPMFFRAPLPLDPVRHAKAGLAPVDNLSFAKATNSIPLNAVEFFEAAKHYPIVFSNEELPMPGVIVGLENDNYFVNHKGHWKEGAYIPAYVRKYPFLFMDMPQQQQLVLCVDEGADQYREQGGSHAPYLFDGKKPSPLSVNALEFCKSYYEHHILTQKFAEDLRRADVLHATRSTARLTSGREIHLDGFLVLDEKKVAQLPDATVLDFHKRGIMPLIYAALLSSSNWKRLVEMASAL